jgi:putative endonuclease
MQTTYIGQRGEQAAVEYLARQGYRIVDRNWRLRSCEIDIVARKGTVMHFVEVKYRSNEGAGSGFDYITPKKLSRMAYAAECWVQGQRWRGEYVLSAIEVGGAGYEVLDFIDSIDAMP